MNTINDINSVTLVSVDMVPTGDSWVASCKVVATRIDGRKYHAHATFEEGFTPSGAQRKFTLNGVRLRKPDGGFAQISNRARLVRANISKAIINELARTGYVTRSFV